MARPEITRSANSELARGAVEGSYKTVNKDRGGVVEMATWDSRRELSKKFGIFEAPIKVQPDGLGPLHDPYAVPTADPDDYNL